MNVIENGQLYLVYKYRGPVLYRAEYNILNNGQRHWCSCPLDRIKPGWFFHDWINPAEMMPIRLSEFQNIRAEYDKQKHNGGEEMKYPDSGCDEWVRMVQALESWCRGANHVHRDLLKIITDYDAALAAKENSHNLPWKPDPEKYSYATLDCNNNRVDLGCPTNECRNFVIEAVNAKYAAKSNPMRTPWRTKDNEDGTLGIFDCDNAPVVFILPPQKAERIVAAVNAGKGK